MTTPLPLVSILGRVNAELISHPWPFGRCPSCGIDRFTVEPADGIAVFTCTGCGARWRYLLGCLIALPPTGDGPVALPGAAMPLETAGTDARAGR